MGHLIRFFSVNIKPIGIPFTLIRQPAIALKFNTQINFIIKPKQRERESGRGGGREGAERKERVKVLRTG